MNLTMLRNELADQAAEMHDYPTDLLPTARRHARVTRIRRAAVAASGSLAVAAASIGAAAYLRAPAPAAEPPAAGVAQPPTPIRSTIGNGSTVELSPGVRFSITGTQWTLSGPPPAGSPYSMVTRDHIRPLSYGEQGLHLGLLPGGRFHTMRLVYGAVSDATFTITLPGRPAASYRADVYKLTSAPGWNLLYTTLPSDGFTVTMQNERRIDVQVTTS